MEQDRASPVLVHHAELAWKTARQFQTIVQLIAATTTNTGLKVRCAIDPKTYPAGVKITDREMDAINILRHSFHGDWNYTIRPKTPVPKR